METLSFFLDGFFMCLFWSWSMKYYEEGKNGFGLLYLVSSALFGAFILKSIL